MSTAFRRHMNNSDTLMWTIEDDPMLRSTITAVAVLDTNPDWDRVVERVRDATVALPRLRQRVAAPRPGRRLPEWVEDPNFDLTYHLRRVVAPPPGDLQTVLDMAATFGMSGFDRARPLWEFTVVEGLQDGRAALVQKLHHSLTDGVGAVKLALELFDRERAGVRPRLSATAEAAEPEPTLFVRLLADAVKAPFRVAAVGVRMVSAPRAAFGQMTERLASIAKILAPATAKMSPLLQGRSLGWSFTAFDVPLATMRNAAAVSGGTVNDAFVAAVAGALRDYHERHGTRVDALRMTLPINLRKETDPLGSNRFSPARFVVPVGERDPVQRMRAIGALVRQWRDEPAVAITEALAAVLNQLPKPVVTSLFGGMLKNVDFVATNVAGIPIPMYLGGAEILREYAFAPPSGAAMNIAFVSHVGVGCVGVLVDRAAVPDPDVFTACLENAFAEMLALAPAPAAIHLAS